MSPDIARMIINARSKLNEILINHLMLNANIYFPVFLKASL